MKFKASPSSTFLSYWLTFAQHVHVGMPSGDEAVAIAKMLKPYLPILPILKVVRGILDRLNM